MSDPRVIALVNERFLPVWINVRESPFPDVPAMDGAVEEFHLGPDRRLTGGFSYQFHARTYAVSPEGRRLLAVARGTTQANSMLKLLTEALAEMDKPRESGSQ
jgi:hypothetical protein